MKTVFGVVVAALIVSCSCLVAQPPTTDSEKAIEQAPQATVTEERPISFWMSVKLEESQSIFAALASSDYETITKSAEGLRTLNKIEGFVRYGDPDYRNQMRSFEFAVNQISKQAKAKNIEGVVLGFHQMTLACVNCHKQLRVAND